MSIPLIAAGAGLIALVVAGSKEKSAEAASGGTAGEGIAASPTQASTGGDNGGAQVPSHADAGAANGEVGASGQESSGYVAAPSSVPAPNPVAPGATTDPWAPSAGPSLSVGLKGASSPDKPTEGALGAVLGIGAVTAKQVGNAFSVWGEALGDIW